MDTSRSIAQRALQVDASGIRRIWQLAANVEDPVDFSIGQPDFDVPDAVKDAAIRAIREGRNRYTVTQGIPELREAVAEHLDRTRGFRPEAVLITTGVSGGLTLSFMALLDAGDELVVPDPFFVIYKHLAAFLGARARYVDTYPDFRLRAERVEEGCAGRPKAMILNSPANPTGAVCSAEELRAVADIARRAGTIVISDEIYDTFAYDGEHTSIASLYEGTVVLGGMSKSLGMPGWRLGYAAGPKDIIDRMATLQQYTFVCAPSFAQHAALVGLGADAGVRVAEYRAKRDLLCDGLSERFELTRPAGAFYAFPKVPWGTDKTFVESAISEGVLIIPGSAFSRRDTHFRIAYATSDDAIRRGVEILNRLAEEGGTSGAGAPA